MDSIVHEIRYAVRTLRAAPTFTLTVVLTVAITIGAVTAVFSVADAVLFRRLAVRDGDELVNFRENISVQSRDFDLFPTPEYERFRRLGGQFSDVAAVTTLDRSNITLSGAGGGTDAVRARVALVSGNYFHMYGVGPERGRLLDASDDRIPSGHPVAVISHAYWMRRLGGSPDVLGRRLTIQHTAFAIIGVMTPAFTGDWIGRPVDIWVPTMMQAEVMVDAPGYLRDRGPWPSSWLRVIGRLKPGVNAAAAEAAAAQVHGLIVREWEGPNPSAGQKQFDASRRLWFQPAARGYSPQRAAFAQWLAVLAALVATVLAIACANIAGLLLVRAIARDREMALRLALGAGRGRLARQMLTESLLLASAGGALGLVLATWGSSALARQVSTGPEKMDWGSSSWASFDVHLDGRVLAFATLTCFVTGVVFGLAPSLRGWRTSLVGLLAGRGAAAGRSRATLRLGRQLVVAQVALSLVLLVGAGLFVRTLVNLRNQDFGFRPQHLLLAWAQAGATGRDSMALRDLYHLTQQRISRIPGVTAAAVSNHGSLDGADPIGLSWTNVQLPGRRPETRRLAGWRTFVTPGYFAAMGIPLIAGRDFTEFDTDTAPRVAIINERFARFYLGDANVIGRALHFGWEPGDSTTRIIGVVRDYINGDPRERDKGLGFAYMPYRDRESKRRLAAMSVAIRTSSDPRLLRDRVRRELLSIDPSLPVLNVDTIDEQLDAVLAQDRLMAGLASFFSIVATLLAALGLYGTFAYATSRRTSEIGIRMALGATPAGVLTMVLGEGLTLIAVGLVLGVLGATWATRFLAPRLFGVGALDPATIATSGAALVGVALIAVLVPASRAARLDPQSALRCD